MIRPFALVILDGFGYKSSIVNNPIKSAYMPTWKALLAQYPHCLLQAAGESVGLPYGMQGNSEVGHLTIGAGRIVDSTLVRINKMISDRLLYDNALMRSRFEILKNTEKDLHIIGLFSDGGIHSHSDHAYALIEFARIYGIRNIYIHAFLDGRDVQSNTALSILNKIDQLSKQYTNVYLASIHGRFYAMDRDENWDRTKKSYDVLTKLNSNHIVKLWISSISADLSEEFMLPQLCMPDGIIKQGDGVIFFNFRSDRARQLTEAFINPAFLHFSNPMNTGNGTISFFMTMICYKKDFSNFNNDVIMEESIVYNTLLDTISSCLPRGHMITTVAETEKYAHITYFLRGKQEKKLFNEQRFLIPSRKVQEYSVCPQMSANTITRTVVEQLCNKNNSVYVINYANADMVGHSGNFLATKKACECLDEQLATLFYEIVTKRNGFMVITADHGNAEEKDSMGMINYRSHTTNKVPFLITSHAIDDNKKWISDFYGLYTIAPIILERLCMPIPTEMLDGLCYL